MSDFKIVFVSKTAIAPAYTENGYNLYASEDVTLEPHVPYCVPTGLTMSFPQNYCALITRYEIKTLAGLVDSDFRGEIKVILVSDVEVAIKRGDVIAKLQMIKIKTPLVEIEQGYPADAKTEVK